MNFKYLNLHFMKEELEFFLGSLIITAEYTPLNSMPWSVHRGRMDPTQNVVQLWLLHHYTRAKRVWEGLLPTEWGFLGNAVQAPKQVWKWL